MAKKFKKVMKEKCWSKWKKPVSMIVYWTIYLTITMALFERFDIVPRNVPWGMVGWGLIVELPRMIVGFLVSKLFFYK